MKVSTFKNFGSDPGFEQRNSTLNYIVLNMQTGQIVLSFKGGLLKFCFLILTEFELFVFLPRNVQIVKNRWNPF